MARTDRFVSNLAVTIRYRPVRIGWCVRHGNWDDLRAALRLTHIFWGGKFNPVIPIGNPSSERLIRQFRVDVLFPINDAPEIVEFAKGVQALKWPLLRDELIAGGAPSFLDISHPLIRIAKELRLHERTNSIEDAPPQAFESSDYVIVHWDADDPLADILLATFGGVPFADQTGRDYEGFFLTQVGAYPYKANKALPLPAELISRSSIRDIGTAELNWDRIPSRSTIGFYAGKANDFEDVVNFWNLQAADLNVVFLDPTQAERMAEIRSAHAALVLKRYEEERQQRGAYASAGWNLERIPIWSRSQEVVSELGFSEQDVPYFQGIEGIDLGVGISPPLHFFSRKEVLGSIADRFGRPTLSLQLPEKPFETDELSQEHFAISVRTPLEDPDELHTFWTPNIPDLNSWYGRQLFTRGSSARAEVDGVGEITEVRRDTLTLTSLKKTELAKKLFELGGIKADVSHPGRIAFRLISQLGGLQGCRVLKVPGVRQLIRKYGPLQEFDRSEAIGLIGNLDPQTGAPRFLDFENLFIEDRDWSTKLKPADVFGYLLDRGVFRAGLTLTCPTCELPFWISLDDASTTTTCEVCGASFNVLRQLKTRDWKYRRSGLFGINNHQEGSIPVALTLQQLHTHLRSWRGSSLFLPNMTLEPTSGNIESCETDIFVAAEDGNDTVLAVGECKDAGGSITAEDARKMGLVADALSKKGFYCYIVFAKTAPFTIQDIENCRRANEGGGNRVIMLSDREIEPNEVYAKASLEFETRGGHSLHEMANATRDIYLLPRPKASSTKGTNNSMSP